MIPSSEPVGQGDLRLLAPVIQDLHDTLMDYRARHGSGRAIAAPQIGVMRRAVYIDAGTRLVLLNPVLSPAGEEMMEVWDDCMSFPGLLVKVRRHQTCTVTYRDLEWRERSLTASGDMAELVQHECDDLDGVLAVAKAADGQSFSLKGR